MVVSRHLKRTIKIMKLTVLMLTVCLSGVFASTYAQTATLNVSAKNETLENVLKQIEKQSEFLFFYNLEDINKDVKISVNAKEANIQTVLDVITKQTGLKYTIRDRHIVLTSGNDTTSVPSFAKSQQTRKVTGKVTDDLGPVAGANVVFKGTSNGTITDSEGVFSLEVAPDAVLEVSYIGYTSVVVPVKGNNFLAIRMEEDMEVLDEVVVVGYGTQKKANLSGAVETVTAKALENRSTNNVGLALQGLVPNLSVSPNGGQADATPSFNIRGETSINGGEPLILVDGIPTSAADFSRMNSMDIENISVLKDAASAAIYGARASFGVILVTTKKGKGEKLTVQFNNNFNVRKLGRMPKFVLNPYIQASYKKIMGQPWYDYYTDEEVAYAQQRVEDPSLPETIISTNNPSQYTYLGATDWYDEIFDDLGISHSHNLSVSGATKKVSYYLGTEYYGESGLLAYNKDQYSRFNVRSKVEYQLADWLKLGNNTALTYYRYDRPTQFDDWIFATLLESNVLYPVYNPDGSFTQEGAQTVGALLYGGDSTSKNTNVYTQFTAQADLVEDVWSIKADFTAKIDETRQNTWQSDREITYRTGPDPVDIPLGWENYAHRLSDQTIYTLLNLYTDFHKEFGKHALSAVAGYSQEYEHYNQFTAQRNDLISDTYPTPQLASGEMRVSEDDYAWAIRSAFYRLNYIYDGKYILETNGRYDGTSRFPHNDRFGFFPSFSGAWVFSQENFMKPLSSWLDHGKLRISYGSLGNQNVDYYSYISSMSASRMNYLVNGNTITGVYTPGLVSNALTWEKVYTLNGGIDLNLLSNRLILSGDVYRRDTKDMLTAGKTLPNVLGADEPRVNAADMKTRGWEVSIMWRDAFNLASERFNYSARFILSDSRSWITRFDNPTGFLDDYYVGCEIGEIWGLETEGFFVDQADIDSHADQWDVTSYPGDRPIEPGDLKYKDLNGDGKINRGSWTVDDPGDFKVIGNSRSRYQFGLDLNADWNGFDLRILFQGTGKRDWYPYPSQSWGKFFGIYWSPQGNVLENNMDHWTEDNPDGYFPRLKSYLAFHSTTGDMTYAQTRYLQNAAYLRLKNLTFGYTIPKHLLRKIKLQNLRVYFSGENLFEATPMSKNFDPEQLDYTTHPMQRTYSIGLNITL